MAERLTRQQMSEQYPNQYLGIRNPHYLNNDGITLTSAEVVYTDKTERELVLLQLEDASISIWYTNDDTPLLLLFWLKRITEEVHTPPYLSLSSYFYF